MTATLECLDETLRCLSACRDVTTQLGSMTIEDLNHWIQFYSKYIMREVDGEPLLLTATQRRMLDLMQSICGHFLSFSIVGLDAAAPGNPYNAAVRQRAAENCKEYARLVEAVSYLSYLIRAATCCTR